MNINRHNYEEFFILYMDNELGNAERRMVETFVQNNPDLKDELEVLLQSRLAPDNNIIFENKDELIRTANGPGISSANYEEWLILYVDNELTFEQKSEVEKFVAASPQAQNELAILQKTKLQPEEIVFPYKDSLYRRTEKVRVVQMRWWRVAVAAVSLLAVSITAFFILSNKKQPGEPVAINPVKNEQKIVKENPVATNTENKNEIVQTGQKEQITEQTPKQVNKQDVPKLANNNIPDKKLPNIPATNKKEEQAIADNNPSNNLPQPVNNPYLKNDAVKTTDIAANTPHIEKTILPTSNGPVTKEPSNPFLTNTTSGKPIENPDAVFASSKENTSLEEGGQNKKSRGFFRKAVRFFEKTTKINPANDDDKVLIGGLAVKLN